MVKRILLALSLITAVAVVAVAAPPPIIKRETRKFDHAQHAASAGASGKEVACSGCHQVDANGAPKAGREHPRCAQCHEDDLKARDCDTMKTRGPQGAARVCQVCHKPTSKRCLPTDLPPLPTEDSFASRFTHGKHLQLGSSIERDCAICHQAQAPEGAAKQVAHRLCAGCHNPNGARPTMSDCASCHVAPTAKTVRPSDPFRLAQFDHKGHHTTSRQASCLGCHDKLTGAGETALPRPSMAACQGKCHDGQKAFSAVGTRCTTCHQGGANTAPVKTRADMAFMHAAHGRRNVRIDHCESCHSSQPDGRLDPPLAGKNHQPCSMSGCHQNEFMSRETKICGVCHDTVAPWAKNVSRPREAPVTEWFESMNHAAHLAKTGTANGACTSCHGEKLTGGPQPQSHEACAACHGKTSKPSMNECGGCHQQSKPVRAAVSTWSVRQLFKHPTHANDPRSRKATQCLDCHTQVSTAKDLASIRPPTMQSCDAACHNGKIAFKTTGFDCAKCHAPPAAAASVGRSEPTAMLQDGR